MMGHLASYFDYKSYARDLFIEEFYFTDGYVFRDSLDTQFQMKSGPVMEPLFSVVTVP